MLIIKRKASHIQDGKTGLLPFKIKKTTKPINAAVITTLIIEFKMGFAVFAFRREKSLSEMGTANNVMA